MHKKVCVYKRLRLQSSSCGRDLISRYCVAEDSTEFSQVHVARAARLFFLTRSIKFLILWRCLCLSLQSCDSSLLTRGRLVKSRGSTLKVFPRSCLMDYPVLICITMYFIFSEI